MNERAPRAADMPPPRDASGLSQGAMRAMFSGTYRWLLAMALRTGLTPFQFTLLSLGTNVVVGVLLLRGAFLAAGLLLVPAGVFDVLDGAVARHRGLASRAGAFLDSFLDRISDLIVFGTLTLALAAQGEDLAAALALVGLIVSLSVSHVRAEAEAAGIPLTAGLMQRMERSIAIVLGLTIPGGLVPALALLAALGAVTLVQRAWMAVAGAGR
ncbi:MAG: CDP-alcohol phosphatidyltransferase family protein [Actinomycetota bacterium]